MPRALPEPEGGVNPVTGAANPGNPQAPMVPETQPTNVGVPDPGQITSDPSQTSPVVSALPPAITPAAAASPASLANSLTTLASDLSTAIFPQVGNLNGLYFAALLYLAWHLYTHHHHWKLALAVVGLDFYLAFFRTMTPGTTVAG